MIMIIIIHRNGPDMSHNSDVNNQANQQLLIPHKHKQATRKVTISQEMQSFGFSRLPRISESCFHYSNMKYFISTPRGTAPSKNKYSCWLWTSSGELATGKTPQQSVCCVVSQKEEGTVCASNNCSPFIFFKLIKDYFYNETNSPSLRPLHF